MPDAEIQARLELALAAAREAGRLTLNYFQQDNFQVERKADRSPVTVADRQAELHLRQRIGERFPDDGIVGEEFGQSDGSSGFQWILDPIDGTKSFITGVPLYGTLVGVTREGASLVGVILIPALDECVYAAKGQGAWYQRHGAAAVPARVAQRSSLADGVFLTSQVDSFRRRGADEAYRQLEAAASITRTWGDCYGYLLVATGRADAMVDAEMSVWDAAALQPILEEAGGAFTDWNGQPTIHGGEGVGCSQAVLPQVLAITRQFPRTSEKVSGTFMDDRAK